MPKVHAIADQFIMVNVNNGNLKGFLYVFSRNRAVYWMFLFDYWSFVTITLIDISLIFLTWKLLWALHIKLRIRRSCEESEFPNQWLLLFFLNPRLRISLNTRLKGQCKNVLSKNESVDFQWIFTCIHSYNKATVNIHWSNFLPIGGHLTPDVDYWNKKSRSIYRAQNHGHEDW